MENTLVDFKYPSMTSEEYEEFYQNHKKRIIENHINSKVIHGLLFYIEGTELVSEKITYLKENYDLVNREGNTLNKDVIKNIIIKYHI